MAERGTNPDGIHDGHRRRIFNKYHALGITNLKECELIEMMLYPMIPRGDTAYIAQNLLERFGSAHNVLTAEYSALAAVEGVGEGLAAEICLLNEFSDMLHLGGILAQLVNITYNEDSSIYSKEWLLDKRITFG